MSDPVPAPPPAAPERVRRIDAVAGGLVVAFALVVASFTARNSDLWLHLATGRLIASGEYRFGADPFTYTAGYWANHAWLFDLGLYLTYSKFGGATLVALKALGVAVAAGLMLWAARGRGPAWVATGCVLLAVLATAPRLLLQPAIASLLLLATCLCCLRAGGRAFRAVPVLIALWVNVDGWFVLGPALVGLFWVGRRIDPNRATLPEWPAWLLPASLAACLLSPHHVFALQLPMELSPAVRSSAFADDPRFEAIFWSPWNRLALGASGGYNPAAWAFVVLLALGVLSFGANRPAVRSWRFAVWLPFAALAAWQARLIPFFAVVAGPITALNLREVIPEVRFRRTGRGAVIGAALALLALACFGWATGVNTRDRGVAWAVHADPGLARAAEGVRAWRSASVVPADGRVFATSADAGHYLAWFAPGERYFLDSRLALFVPVAPDFVAVLPPGELVQGHRVAAVLLHDPDAGRMTRGLAAVGGYWRLARVEGAAALLVPPPPSREFDAAALFVPPGAGEFDAFRAAFGGRTELPVADVGPAALTEPVEWWKTRPERGRVGSAEADEAAIYLRLAEIATSNSPALPLLAVRGARVGIERDPRDPTAWLVLGRAYLFLAGRSTEHNAGLTPLEHIRQLQATAALVQAALANPDSLPAHDSLAQLFSRRNMLDVGLRHTVAAERLLRRATALARDSSEEAAERTRRLADAVTRLSDAVQDAQNRFVIRTTGLAGDPLAQARIAVELGLTQKALDVLLASHSDLYGAAGVSLLAELLLQVGLVSECRALLDRSELRLNPHAIGQYPLSRKPNADGTRWTYPLRAYDWFDLCQCAAAGHYDKARAALARLCDRLEVDERSSGPRVTASSAVSFASEVGFGATAFLPTQIAPQQTRAALIELTTQVRGLSVSRADLLVLGGVLELERGDRQSAAAQFEAAQALYAAAKAVPNVSRPGEPLAERYYYYIRRP